MKRLIIDAKKITPEILSLIKEKYPEGYDDISDVLTFRNAKGEIVEAIEVRDNDNIYLVKIGSYLNIELSNFEANIEEIKEKPKEVSDEEIDDDDSDEYKDDALEDDDEDDEDDDEEDKEEIYDDEED